jgi:hypothetical protein
MTIICSWCRHEGQTGVVGEKAPLDDRRETHGICLTHRSAVQARWKEPMSGQSARRNQVHPFSATQIWAGIMKLARRGGW